MTLENKNENTQTEPPRCAICGKPITKGCTIDHVIPQAIYKWHEQYLNRPEFVALRKRITSPRNTVRTHRNCNERKEESIVRINGLHVSRAKRTKLHQTYTAVEPYIEAFLKKKDELREKQQGRCFICGKPLMGGGVLRRIDETLERIWDNACLICHRCNCKVKSKDVKTYRLSRGHSVRSAAKPAKSMKPAASGTSGNPYKEFTALSTVSSCPPAASSGNSTAKPSAPGRHHRRRRHRRAKKTVTTKET